MAEPDSRDQGLPNNNLDPVCLPRPSYVRAASPSQHEDLRHSLVQQVVNTRKNLVSVFEASNNPSNDFIKVFLRIRPFQEEELRKQEDQDCVEIQTNRIVTLQAPPTSAAFKNAQSVARPLLDFTFSHVFGPSTSQKEFFDSSVGDTVPNFLRGHNGLVFSYGVTNSGKTYTIQGTDSDPGVIPRSLELIFDSLRGHVHDEIIFKPHMNNDVIKLSGEQRAEESKTKNELFRLAEANYLDSISELNGSSELTKASSFSSFGSSHSVSTDADFSDSKETECEALVDEKCKYLIWVSFLEIYNEQIFDLLEPMTAKRTRGRVSLKLQEDKKGNIFVKGLRHVCVGSANEAFKLLIFGQKNLSFAATKLNYNSSRSHCIYSIQLLKLSPVGETEFQVTRMSKLSFCDLAGSERSSKTHGHRILETGSINKSLLTLGKCIAQLRANQAHRDRQQLIPFRDSKLTRILQTFLVGRGMTKMVVNVNQCGSCFDETLAVMKFSAIAKQIRANPVANPEWPIQLPPPATAKLSRAEANRLTMKWASEADRASMVPLPENGMEVDEENEEGEMDRTMHDNAELRQYQELVETLRNELIAEKRRNLKMEAQIREEVCNEFSSQLEEMESRYSDVRREEQEGAEELAEARLELYVKSAQKKAEKLRRLIEEEEEADGDFVDVELLNAERKRVEVMEKEILDLNEKIRNLEKALPSSGVAKEISRASKMSDDSLEGGVEALRRELEAKDQELKEMNECLEEAGRTFEEKEGRIKALEELVNEEKNAKQALIGRIEGLESKLKTTQEKLSHSPANVGSLSTSTVIRSSFDGLGGAKFQLPLQPRTSPGHKRKSPAKFSAHSTAKVIRGQMTDERVMQQQSTPDRNESTHSVWTTAAPFGRRESNTESAKWESTRLEDVPVDHLIDRDACLAALSPIREAENAPDRKTKPKIQLNDSTIHDSQNSQSEVIQIETIKLERPTAPHVEKSPKEGLETPKKSGPEFCRGIKTPQSKKVTTPWRKRWSRMVKSNKAAKLRINASPSVKHNHETGSLYHLNGEQAEALHRNMTNTVPRAGGNLVGNLLGTLTGKKSARKRNKTGRSGLRRSSTSRRRSGKVGVTSTKRRLSGAPRVVLKSRIFDKKLITTAPSENKTLLEKILISEFELAEARAKMDEQLAAQTAAAESAENLQKQQNTEIERLQEEVQKLQEDRNNRETGGQQDQGFKLIELESKIFELEASLSNAESESARLRAHTKALENSKDEEIEKREKAEESLMKDLSDSKDLVKNLEQKVEELKKLEEEADRANKKEESLLSELRDFKETIEKLESRGREDSRKLKDYREDLDRIRKERDSLKKEIKDEKETQKLQEIDIEEFRKEAEKREKEITDLKSKMEHKEADWAKLEKDNRSLIEAMREFDAEKKELKAKLESMSEEKSKWESGSSEEIDQLEQKLKAKIAELKDAREMQEEAGKRADESAKKLEASVSVTADIQKKLENEQKRSAALAEAQSKTNQKLTESESQLASTRNQLAALKSHQEEKEKEMKVLQANLSDLKTAEGQAFKELETAKLLQEKLEETIRSQKQLSGNVEQEFASAKSALEDLKKQKSESSSGLATAKLEIECLKETLGKKESTLEEQVTTIGQLKKEKADLESLRNKYKSGLKETEDVQQKFEKLLERERAEKEQLLKNLEAMRNQMTPRMAQLHVAEENVARMTHDLSIKNQIEIELRNKCAVEQKERERIQQQLKDLQSSAAKMDRQRQALDANNGMLSKQLRAAQENLLVFQTETASTRSKFEEKESKLKKLESDLKESTKKHAQEMAAKDRKMREWEEERDQLVANIRNKLGARDQDSQRKEAEIDELKGIIGERDETIARLGQVSPGGASGSGRNRRETQSHVRQQRESSGDVDEMKVVESVEVSPFEMQSKKSLTSAKTTGKKKASRGPAKQKPSVTASAGRSSRKRSVKKETLPPPESAQTSTTSIASTDLDEPTTGRKRTKKTAWSPAVDGAKPSVQDLLWPEADRPQRRAKSNAKDRMLATALQSSPFADVVSAVTTGSILPDSPDLPEPSIAVKKKRGLFKSKSEKLVATPPTQEASFEEPINAVSVVTKQLKSTSRSKTSRRK